MIDIPTLQASVSVVQAILIIWFVSMAARELRTIAPFAPFILISVVMCGFGTLYYYELLLTVWQFVFASAFCIGHAWLLWTLVQDAAN